MFCLHLRCCEFCVPIKVKRCKYIIIYIPDGSGDDDGNTTCDSKPRALYYHSDEVRRAGNHTVSRCTEYRVWRWQSSGKYARRVFLIADLMHKLVNKTHWWWLLGNIWYASKLFGWHWLSILVYAVIVGQQHQPHYITSQAYYMQMICSHWPRRNQPPMHPGYALFNSMLA